MKLNKSALWIAIGWFLIWFGLAYLIADHPVPDGFFWVPLSLLIAAGLVYWRVPVYQKRITSGQRGSFWLALLEGLVAGLVLAVIIVLLPNEPEPGMPAPGVGDYVFIFAMMGFLGTMNAVGVHLVTRLLSHSPSRRSWIARAFPRLDKTAKDDGEE